MAPDQETEFALPSIPYFYHDIVARIIPGMIQLGLITALATCPSTAWIQKLKLETVPQLWAVLVLLAAAYFVGVFFEGVRLAVPLFHLAFLGALTKTRRSRNVTGQLAYEQAVRLAEETSSILESYEPLVPHFFARATRFHAEAKMMLCTAFAVPIAVAVVRATKGDWPHLGGYGGIARGFIVVAIFVIVAHARQGRRGVEILRCVEYLALRTKADNADASKRAQTAWAMILAPSSLVGPTGSREGRIQEYWPFLVGGILAPFLSNILTRWLPLQYAVAGANFGVWFAAIWLFQRASGRSENGIFKRLATSAVAGVAAGILALLFPWK